MTDWVQQLIGTKDPPEQRIRIVEDVEEEEGTTRTRTRFYDQGLQEDADQQKEDQITSRVETINTRSRLRPIFRDTPSITV